MDVIEYQRLKNLSVSELRTITRERNIVGLSGLTIAGMKKEDLINAVMGNGNGEVTEIKSSDTLADAIAMALQGKIKSSGINRGEVEAIVSDMLSKKLLPQTIEVKLPTGEIKPVGLQHDKFRELIALASARLDTMLVGAAGSGKTTICHSIAGALGLPFSFLSVGNQTTKTDLMGYMDAKGEYVKTHLRQAYEFGGVFLLDEIDAGNANTITVLNSLLDNAVAAFPDKLVKRHPNFIFFGAANTFGKGADRVYIGRNQLDGASIERFVFVNLDYDEKLENALTGNSAWTQKVQKIRAKVFNLKLHLIVSPRASIKGLKLLELGFKEKDILDIVIFKGCNQEIKSKVMEGL